MPEAPEKTLEELADIDVSVPATEYAPTDTYALTLTFLKNPMMNISNLFLCHKRFSTVPIRQGHYNSMQFGIEGQLVTVDFNYTIPESAAREDVTDAILLTLKPQRNLLGILARAIAEHMPELDGKALTILSSPKGHEVYGFNELFKKIDEHMPTDSSPIWLRAVGSHINCQTEYGDEGTILSETYRLQHQSMGEVVGLLLEVLIHKKEIMQLK